MTKSSRRLLKLRLIIGVVVITTLIFIGTLLENNVLVALISILGILAGAYVTDRVFTRKDRHIDFLESMEKVNDAIADAENVQEMLFNVLSVVQKVLKTDRAWLLYPCDPNTDTWKVPMEVTRKEYPGAMAMNEVVAMSEEAAQLFQKALDAQTVEFVDYRKPNMPQETVDQFSVLTQIHIALRPKIGLPWLFGVHQCSHAKVWSDEEMQLFTEISRRLNDGLASFLYLRNLSESEYKSRSILDSATEAIYGLDNNGICTFCNAACVHLLGVDDQSDLLGKNMHELIHHTHNDGSNYAEEDCPVFKTFGKNLKCHVDSEVLYRTDGSCFPAEYWSHPIANNGEVMGCVVTFLDITDRRKRDEQLSYQASHDSLTGLLNRFEFEKRLSSMLKAEESATQQHAMCFLDLDQFKVINDTCGHMAGDELLKQVGEVLTGSIRLNDTLARIGGDEFGILMQRCTVEQATRVANEVLSSINDYQFVWEDNFFHIRVSIGLVPIESKNQLISDLFMQADAACYLAKDAGRNQIHIYHPNDTQMAERQGEMKWVAKIYSAIEENRLRLYAQPIFSIKNSADRHYEILLRMIDETGRVIAPGAFLPAAERYDIIEQLDTWVVENCFKLLSESPIILNKVQFVSINLSGKSLTNDNLLQTIIRNLRQTKIDAGQICFEITETAAIANFGRAVEFVTQLKQEGFQFALDDFGTGMSSFGYLRKLPVDYLKIDGSFVKEIVDNPIDYHLVKTISGIGQVMGMKTIAEFVENDEILEKLVQINVDYAQGYGLGKPEPVENIVEQLSSSVSP